jgi:ribonuclease P protein component
LLPRLTTAEQFSAVLKASQQNKHVYRSAHFALHWAASEAWPKQPLQQTTVGVIAPKRWAKRAVTRNCIKRQVYAVTQELSAQLPCAYLVLRQHAAFSRDAFPSASSAALKQAVRTELLGLLARIQPA